MVVSKLFFYGYLVLLNSILETFLIYIYILFSGKCPPDGNPCTQICFNIHNNMYECGCKNGFVLSADGYNCILQEGKLRHNDIQDDVWDSFW